jgi:phosphate transport system substrate-binding protein
MTVRHSALLCLLLAVCCSGLACGDNTAKQRAAAAGTLQLRGAGATFPAPLYKKWLEEYQRRHPEVQLSYDAIGSGEGVKQFMAGAVDFGASDAAMRDEQMAAVARGVQLLPAVAGSIVLAYNLDGLRGDLKLTRDVYIDIFLGKIKTWDDPRIIAINPGLRLPNTNIALVVRQDSSGTTYAFTNHLSAISETWRDQGPGVGVAIAWPSHPMVAPGNEGVAGRIKVSQGAMGYVEYGIAQRAGLSMAWLENRAGQFVQPHGGSGLATLLNVTMPENLRAFFPDPEGQDSYPIVTYSWLLLYKEYDDQLKAAALKQYVKWCLTEGQAFNETLGYVRLTPQVITRTMAALDSIR